MCKTTRFFKASARRVRNGADFCGCVPLAISSQGPMVTLRTGFRLVGVGLAWTLSLNTSSPSSSSYSDVGSTTPEAISAAASSPRPCASTGSMALDWSSCEHRWMESLLRSDDNGDMRLSKRSRISCFVMLARTWVSTRPVISLASMSSDSIGWRAHLYTVPPLPFLCQTRFVCPLPINLSAAP